MRKPFLLIILISFFFFGCGKKGPIDLPASGDYTNDHLHPPEEVDLDITSTYTHISQFDPFLSKEGWVGRAQDTEIRLICNAPAEIADDPSAVYTLRLYLISKIDLSSLDLTIAPLTTSWSRTYSTWENKEKDTPWETPGGDFDLSAAVSYTVTEEEGSEVLIDISSLFDYWAQEDNENHGFIIMAGETLTQSPAHLIFGIPFTTVTEEKPAIIITYGEEEESVDVTVSAHIADTSDNPEYENDPGIFALGDGYVPVMTPDFSSLEYRWDILEATLSFDADPVLMKHYFGVDIDDLESTTNKLSCYAIADENPSTFSYSKRYSQSPGYDETTSRFTLNITGALDYAFRNNQPVGIVPESYRAQLRLMDLANPAIHVVYRKNIEEYDYEVNE